MHSSWQTAALAGLSLLGSLAHGVALTGYEYVVVGSGAGGGPLAARLAMAGHKTLLIEAGDDQGNNPNYTVPAFSGRSSEDDKMAWNFYVRHYADDARQARDFKTSYRTPDGELYTGLHPPAGSTMLGTLYPRAGTLGGCTAHNALVAIYPHRSDFERIAAQTGDGSWAPDAMRKYFVRLERNRYLLPGARGHGYSGWLDTDRAPLTIPLQDPRLLSMILGGSFALGNHTRLLPNLLDVLAGDANEDSEARDRDGGYFQVPLSSGDGRRSGARDFVVAVRDAKNRDGTSKYPLDVRMNCHVTRVVFDETGAEPRATGVEFLDGAHLYRASPRSGHGSGSGSGGVAGSATASREVIVAGGTYNSPQILKLSGVGPAQELARFGIKVVKDLPGVGTNLQDHYEVAVQGRISSGWRFFEGCTFSDQGDPCLSRWQHPVLGSRGPYVSDGFAAAMMMRTSRASEYDAFVFGGPINFRGYFPGYAYNVTADHDVFTWAILKSHPRNTAGRVALRSADPLDVPDIVYNSFDTGSGDSAADVAAIREAIGVARDAFRRQLVDVEEMLPGPGVRTTADLDAYIKDTVWGHHASSTCPIGADDDPMAVLDSSFRVRGVRRLRVVDASVYPRIPGTFTAVSTYMVAEKAADVILSQNK
ncbi:Glucose-methanol-choline oxidoreductase [Metarhizium album ARSEF 1941]|uniref:Glucose-methanol-choline oxidoreductase n=1 Tax=Metarhizium album (strain ARSEF 1941) TaxID=1081103 RepID=A0A0B2WLE3_METAS|nr:Glucose-methanol-choline oxidoreductase [Metarhizium album ARSEF 1941]KHN94519.1 Glucose-methanol-choline oxidoreductase [Metarhizium album ARSEF 1941]